MSAAGPDEPAERRVDGVLQRGELTAASPGETSELLTFLFADIRGYTTFTQQRGDEAAEKLTRKFAVIVRDLVTQFGGTVFEFRGDEAMCTFASPRESLRLAIALQQRFVEETVADVSLPMTVGIGIDVGEAVHGREGYRGGALNLAARLCARAKAGDVLASSEVTHLARTIAGVRYVVLDGVALKGFSDPVRPVRVLPDGEDPARQIAALLAAASPAPQTRAVRWLPGPLATRARMTLSVAAVAVLVAGALVFAVWPGARGTRLKALGEDSIGVLDPGNARFVGQVRVGAGSAAVAAGYGAVWTANTDANTVSRMDISSRQVHTISVETAPAAIAVGLSSVWVANSGSGTVTRIDLATYQTQSIVVGAAPGGIAVSGGSIWVTNTGAGTVSVIDPAQNKVVHTVEVGAGPSGIAAGRDIWVANSDSNTVSKIDGRTHAVSLPIAVGNDPQGIAVIGDNVWVTNHLDGTVSRIATSGPTVAETERIGLGPTQIATIDGHVWVAMQASGAIAEIDPGSARVIRTVPVGAIPGGIAAAAGKLWVSTSIDPARHRGGTIRILGVDVESIDPTYGGSISAAWLLNGSYDGLVGFQHATGAEGTVIVPDLATAIPIPSNGGRTYSFQLRGRVSWSTGAALTVFDVRRGLERTIAAGGHPGVGEIVGAGGCRPSHCDVAGIAVDAAAGIVAITLVRPDDNFLDDLAVGTFAVPAAWPLTEQKTRPTPVTGPYQIARYIPGKLVVLTRNRFFQQWSAAAQPAGFPDSIEWTIDSIGNAKRAVDDVAAGQTDWADVHGSEALGILKAGFGIRVHVTPTEAMFGLSLNTRIPPFNKVEVRRALALAIDRTAIAHAWTVPATVTCQILPPDYPGYRPYCPYTLRPDDTQTWHGPDFVKAQALMNASHTRGMTVTVWSLPNQAPGLRPVVSALVDLGFHAHLSVYTKPDYFAYVGDSRNKVQAAFFGWVAGDASAVNFLSVWACDAFTPASPDNINPAEFCDRSIDRLVGRAERVQTSSLAAANDLWAEVDRHIVDAAPWIPLVTPSQVEVLSTRVHNYKRSPVLGVLFDQMWVR